ncbi:MAG: hypothetical protein POELPBGB_00288 [Bacteroidia bacterium]|nr:hypothetical protein [Bacteroidia bacterium]
MKKTITLLISAALLMVMNVRGQTVAGTFIDAVASGGFNTTVPLGGQQINVNWTVGQTVIDFPTNEDDNQTQGFNQAFKECVFYDTVQWAQVTIRVPDTSPLAHPGDSIDVTVWQSETGQFPHQYTAPWCVTSVYENPDNITDGIEIYPNPAAEVLTVVIPETLNPTSVASFFDINGRLAQQVNITANRQEMEVATLTPGMYFIIINAKNGQQLSTHKLIKK